MLLIRNLLINVSLVSLIGIAAPSYATIYFQFDAENLACDGSELPIPPFWTSTVAYRGHISCDPSPQGTRHIEFTTKDNQSTAYTEINKTQDGQAISINNIIGKTYYLAYYFNFTRINGNDIWKESTVSGDKGIEFDGNGIRWILGRGQYSKCNGSYSPGFARNKDHHYTVWVGNPTYHLNPDLEGFATNLNGYSCANPLQLKYDQWHSAVMALKVANDNTGSVSVYIDGVKVMEYNNIRTAANSNPSITRITMGGTIAQPANDAPAHHRKFDAMLLTDNWQDIIDGGYLEYVAPPKPPTVFGNP